MERPLRLTVLIFWVATLTVQGYPELGFLAKLPSDIAQSSSGWKKVSGWVTTLVGVKGLYNFEADFSSDGNINIAVSGLFFASVTIPVNNADVGLFKASLVINDITSDKEIGLQCRMENSTSGVQMLSFAGFISFRAGEKVSVYVYSSSDTSWTIKSQSSISFHLFGNFGSSPGFLVTPGATRTLNNPSNQQLTSWSKSGRAGLFQSLTGLTTTSGKFTTVCSGLNILTANIIFEGAAGTYSVGTVFNGKRSILGTVKLSKRGITTLNVYQAFFLPKGSNIYLTFTSDAGQISILSQSTWSMAYIGGTSSNIPEFASYLKTTVEQSSTSWNELTGLLRTSATQTADGSDSGQTIQPSNLNLVNQQNLVMSEQTELYYAFVHLVYSGNATNIESMIAVSADKTTSTGKEGVYGSFTKVAQETGTISLAGIFHVRKLEHLSVFIKPNAQVTIHNTSFTSMFRMRYVVSAFGARIQTKMVIQKSGWSEITGPWLTETYGKFSYGTDFSATTGRFTASQAGVYIFAANIKINNGQNSEIALLLVKNGVIDVNNGLYAVEGEPSSATTLNLYGTVSVKTGDVLSLYAYRGSSTTWEIDVQSGFSITYMGPNWAAVGFHAVLSNDIVGGVGQSEINGWTTNSSYNSMAYSNGPETPGSMRYTSLLDGIYIVSANILVQNVSAIGSSNGFATFDLQAFVNGFQANPLGLSDIKPGLADNTRDYYTLSFSGSVRMTQGQFISLFLTTGDGSYVISKQSGFSIVLASAYTHKQKAGFLGTKNVASYLSTSAVNTWTPISDIETSVIPGRYKVASGNSLLAAATFSVTEPGLFYIFGNVRLNNAGGGTLFEAHAEIDSQRSVTYGMYAVEGSPKGISYGLNFAGTVYLTSGQVISIMVRTAKNGYSIEPGSSFSIVKLQFDDRFPGFVVDKTETSFQPNQILRSWEETGKPGLLTSNIGFNAPLGSYTPPVTGVYIASINNYLGSITGNSSISLIRNDSTSILKAYGSEGVNRTKVSTSALYLSNNQTYNHLLSSSVPDAYPMEAGWSVYYINPIYDVTGFSGPLGSEFTVSSINTWITVKGWNGTNSSSGFSTVLPSNPDEYTATKAGLHFVSFVAVFGQISSAYDIKIAVYINQALSLYASFKHIAVDELKSVPISGTVKLNIGDIISFKVHSSVTNLKLTAETTRSLIFIEGITTNTEGAAAYLPATQTLIGNTTAPYQLKDFVATMAGSFLPQNETLDSSGALINFHAGVFLYTANIVVKNTENRARKFHLRAKLDNTNDIPVSLQSIETIPANSEETLAFSSSMFLPRFSRVQTFISTEDNAPFQIISNSTFTFVLIDDNTGPVLCEDSGLNLEALNPSYVRISTEKSVTFTCTVVGSIPATLSWFKNGQLISGATGSTYTISSTRLADSGNYHCKAVYRSLTATTNNATLSVYDPTPSISATLYTVSVNENLPAGYTVMPFTVSADKFAIGQKALVSVHIVTGDPDGDLRFSNASTSLVTLQSTRPLDYEKKSFYQLSITAVNTEEPDARNTTITFNITINDANDNGPVFNPSLIQQSVPEDLAVGSPVVTVTAVDQDSGAFGIVSYRILSNLSRSFFAINSSTGVISLEKGLDRETEDRHILIIEARDSQFISVAEIVLNVTDVNDNQPVFNPSSYVLTIVENTLVGSSVVQVFASDPDLGLNSTLVYSILSGNTNGHFSIDNQTGVVSLSKALDYESITSFHLIIGLRDMGSPIQQSSNNATVTINIADINDNFAYFEKTLYTKAIAENTAISASVLQVVAVDRDGTVRHSNLTFSINQTLASSKFQIDPITGVITVKEILDYEQVKEYHFSVIATDNGTVPYQRHTNVIIYITNVNDEAPYLMPTSYNVNISEFARPGSMFLQVFGYDNDTRSLQYSITSQSPKNDFRIDLSTGTLFVQNYLDRENISSYSLVIGLGDGLNSANVSASVSITITDENDNKPRFANGLYETTLAENSSVGASVLIVSASDDDIGSNAAITYSIFNSGLNGSALFFNINSSTGLITLARPLDYETAKEHSFIVVATDGGRIPLRGHTSVLVRVKDSNDNAPYFEPNKYTVTIVESSSINSIVSVITAKDNDTSSSQLTYQIVGGNVNSDFKLQAGASYVNLVVAKALDYERTRNYTILIQAYDGIHYSSNNATVVVSISDVNDNNPVFIKSYYSVAIPENTNTSYGFLQVAATDNDGSLPNNQVTYFSLDNTTDFTLSSSTGHIYVSSIDFERKSQYSLVVIATDNGSPPRMARSLVDITITDINDNPPTISPTFYHVNVSEAALIGLHLTTVKATDKDTGISGQLVFSFVGGVPSHMFTVNADTGEVYLNGSLDYEGAAKNYTLTVAVADRGGLKASSNATIFIQVFDINDNQPVFDLNEYQVNIREDTIAGTSIVTVHASDRDGTLINSNMNYYIVSTTDSGNFSINSTTGQIKTSQTFDYERLNRYVIEVEARDTGNNMLKGRCLVVVQITDINDNAPKPDLAIYQVNISSSLSVGAQVLTLFSTDPDSGINSQLRYAIINGDPSGVFSINNQGVISLANTLATVAQSSYNLTVRVSDLGSPSLNTNITVIIRVSTEPTSAIAFDRLQYTFNVNENLLQAYVGAVHANDTGNITSTFISYSVVANSNQILGIFHLDSATGNIYMNKTTNYEARKQYDFTVRAINNAGNVAYTHVTIVIVDVNEAPYFVNTIQGNYTFNVSEAVPPYSFIHAVYAMDNDTGANGQLVYSLVLPSADQNMFIIDQSGRIFTKSALDYETKQTYNFQVIVQDGGTPSLNATVNVNIAVLDFNDNHPIFGPLTPENITVTENTASGTELATVVATDRDSGVNAQIEYLVYPSGIATMNSSTGVLKVDNLTYFDFEKAQFYDLIVLAKDMGTPHLQTSKIIRLFITNINDNNPYFIQSYYNISVAEVTPVGTMLLPLHALDNDLGDSGMIASYAITSGGTSKFRIDNNGKLYLASALQYSVARSYTLNITATDGGSPNRTAQATVLINVLHISRQQPVFLLSTYYKTVVENMNLSQVLLQVNATSSEAIHGPFVYSIISSNVSQYFSIDNTTGVIRNLIRFDFEAVRSYSFTVQVLDTNNQRTGVAHVVITVTDQNDNTPVFTNVKQTLSISEATHVGALVLTLTAADNDSTTNGMIRYFSVGGDGAEKFTVETDGKVYLKASVDSKVRSNYTLIVKAQDMGSPSLHTNLTLTIFILPANLTHLSQPSFNQTSYIVYVNEGTTVNSLLVVLATNKATSSVITYTLTGSSAETSPFLISSNGSISLTTALDYEAKRLYQFTCRATNNEGRTADAPITVHVIDINDNRPYFQPALYTREISEYTPVGQTILHLMVKDNDTVATNGPYQYMIVQGNNNNNFNVTGNGYIRLANMIDYDTMVGTSFTLIVSVSEGYNPSISNATVTISIRNENDLRPVFSQGIYNFNVSENSVVGYSLGMLNATDADRISPSNQIVFSLAATSNDFALSSSGNLTVIKRLNYESVRYYELVAIAMDAGSPSLRSTAIIKINVLDVNEERPYFKVASYSRNISEAFPVGSTVLIITANDDDTGVGGVITYSLADPTSTFSINPSSGAIMLSTALNYETRNNYTLNITATDGGGNSGTNSASVLITVTDVNDNEPRFSANFYAFNVQENFNLHGIIGQVSAVDSDLLYNTISYSIDANEDSGNFSIHNNGSITLSSSLNYESVSKYTLLVKARDNGRPILSGSAMVTINVLDINDNAPEFIGRCNNTISEASPVGMIVVTCKAMDRDAGDTLTYRLNGSDYFSVNNDGIISLKKPLDYQSASVHNLTLIVSDGVHQTSTSIRIIVTQSYLCRPAFNQSLYENYIREDVHVTSYVLTVRASDARNRTIAYSLQSGVTDFSIDSSTGEIKTAALLNYHSKNLYVFKVLATAGTSVEESVIIIRIIDINNRAPIPGQLVYSVRISEKAVIGAVVIGINATDPDTNSRLTYSIKSGNILNSFRVDSSGRILVNRQLDYELVPSYRLLVGVNDGAHETNVQINIEVIDINEPTTCGPCIACPHVSTFDFSKPAYVAKVSENMTANTVISTVELNQASKSRLIVGNYSIKDATALQYFIINSTSGQIRLKSSLSTATLLGLNKYTFTVYNQFQCREAAAEVIIDNQLTGCPFAFSRYHYEATLPEDYPLKQGFLTVSTQPPSASAIYTIVENVALTIFQINSTTGVISLNSSLNYAFSRRHQFTVKVNVTKLISYVTVIIYVTDVNNNCPQVATVNGTYYQPVQLGSIMGRVIVTDVDTFKNHSYAITGGDVNGNFSIDSNGIVTAKTVIIASSTHIYNLQITINDGLCSKVATMTIVIHKDVPPACPTPPSCYNYTCAPCPTTQPITQCPKKFCPGCPICPTTNAPCPTTLPATSCPVKTCPTCPVTCPATVTCPVCPTLHCPGCPAFSSYTFKKPYYTISVYENRTNSSELLSVSISGGYAATYTIVEAEAKKQFHIDANSGKISLIAPLNYTLQKSHQFNVRATIGSEYSDAIVVVNVLDVNNNCPVFDQNEVYARLTTPVESGTMIAMNKATDADTGPALTYSIIDGDTADEFSIDSMGIIRTKKRVVVAGSKTFNLTLSASDSVCTAFSRAIIIIHLDTMFTVTPSKCPVFCPACPICTGVPVVSTSAPATCPSTCQTCLSPSNYVFRKAYYTVTILENTTYSNSILKVDLLSGSAGANFSIVEASALEYFRINRTTGEIFLIKNLDYETIKRHNFTVEAMFAGGFKSQVLIEILVTNIDDNYAYFVTTTYNVTIHEFTEVGTRLLQVLATDIDDKNSVAMTISSGNTNTAFSIEPQTGYVAVNKALYLYPENIYTLIIGFLDTRGPQALRTASIYIRVIRMSAMKTGCQIFGSNSYQTVSMSENVSVGTLVADLNGTPVAPGRNIMYSITNNASKEFFQINSTTGRITTKSMLNYEHKTSHLIIVAATDQVTGIASQAIIAVSIVNVPDGTLVINAPVAVTVSEMSSRGSIVALITANSNDSQSAIRYYISSGNTNGLFSIDAATGVVRLNSTLSHDASSSHMVSICAMETISGTIKCHNLTVNVKNENNKQTTFGQTSYQSSTPLSSAVGTFVARISATDPDGLSRLRYTLDGAIANEYFSINQTTGAITLKKSLSGTNFSTPIVISGCATDNGSPQTTTCVPVIVNTGSTIVALPNNYYPTFTSSQYNAVINENATIGSTVLTIAASDNDTGAAGVVYYKQLQGTGSDHFALNSDTGEITTVKLFNTTSTPKVFFLKVAVRDRGNPVKYSKSNANLTIAVQSPSYSNNFIASTSSTTMSIVLSKEPFDDSKILNYQIVAQQYDQTIANFEAYSAMHYVSWYFVHFKQTMYRYRRFVIASIPKTPTSKRKRREIKKNTNGEVQFDVGIQKNCHLKTLESDVCNGALLPGMSYRFQLVGFYAPNNPVTGAFTAPRATTQVSTATQTGVVNSAYVVTYWIIGLVVLSLMFFLAFLVIVVIFCYKRKYRVYDVGPKTFINPVYTENQKLRTDKDNLNFYASDSVDGYQDVGTLKEERPHSHAVDPEDLELVEQHPISTTLNTPNTLTDYETISNKLTFEEENPEWVPMDIRLRVDPTGETDPVIITKEEASSETGSGKKSSASSHSSSGHGGHEYPAPDYEDSFPRSTSVRDFGTSASGEAEEATKV